MIPTEGRGEGWVEEDDVEFCGEESGEKGEREVGRGERVGIYRGFFEGEKALLFGVPKTKLMNGIKNVQVRYLLFESVFRLSA